MGEDRLTFSVGGEFAEAIRQAAQAAGVSPAEWVGTVVARQLAGASPPSEAAGPGALRTAPGSNDAPVGATPGTVPWSHDAPAASGTQGDPATTSLSDPAAWEQLTDETGTFSVRLPRGWQNRAWVVPTPAMKYPMVTASTPDGRTTLFSGDAEIPMFIDPSTGMFPAPPGMVLRPPTPAQQFLSEWVQYRHGGRRGFRLLGMEDDPQLVEVVAQAARRTGMQPTWLTGARARAEFTGDAGAIHAVFLVVTVGMGVGWFAQVHGVTSAGDPTGFVPALLELVASAESTPAEKQRLQAERMANDAQHQATMQMINQNTAMMTAQHQQRMANIHASGIAHQQNMAAQQATFDAGVESWRQQQAGADAQQAGYMSGLRTGGAVPGAGGNSQQDFINMINEERTVLDAEGQTHQVAAGADRYYHNQHTNTWIGLEAHQDIVEVAGVDRDDYQEGTIQS